MVDRFVDAYGWFVSTKASSGCFVKSQGFLLHNNRLAIEGRELYLLGEVVKDLLQGSLAAGVLFDGEVTLSLDALKVGMEVSDRRLELSSGSLDMCVITF
jgi:hypothetical protein